MALLDNTTTQMPRTSITQGSRNGVHISAISSADKALVSSLWRGLESCQWPALWLARVPSIKPAQAEPYIYIYILQPVHFAVFREQVDRPESRPLVQTHLQREMIMMRVKEPCQEFDNHPHQGQKKEYCSAVAPPKSTVEPGQKLVLSPRFAPDASSVPLSLLASRVGKDLAFG